MDNFHNINVSPKRTLQSLCTAAWHASVQKTQIRIQGSSNLEEVVRRRFLRLKRACLVGRSLKALERAREVVIQLQNCCHISASITVVWCRPNGHQLHITPVILSSGAHTQSDCTLPVPYTEIATTWDQASAIHSCTEQALIPIPKETLHLDLLDTRSASLTYTLSSPNRHVQVVQCSGLLTYAS